MRGEPLRARFQLSAIRLALKRGGGEGEPGFAVLSPEMNKSLTMIDGRRPQKFHMIALLK